MRGFFGAALLLAAIVEYTFGICSSSTTCYDPWMPIINRKINYTYMKPDLLNEFPFPFHLQKTKCHLAIIAAGAPRSGSTLQNEIARRAATILVKHSGTLRLRNAGYWMPHVHSNSRDVARRYIETSQKEIVVWDDKTVLLVKTHDFDRNLLTLCTNYIVLTTYRDPVNMISSFVRRSWISNSSVEQMCIIAKHAMTRHLLWSSYANVNSKYERVCIHNISIIFCIYSTRF